MPSTPRKLVSPSIDTSRHTRDPPRLGPWLLKRAYTESSLPAVAARGYQIDQEQPSLSALLKKVDEECKTIEKLRGFDPHDGEERHEQQQQQRQGCCARESLDSSSCMEIPSLTHVSTRALPKTPVSSVDRTIFWGDGKPTSYPLHVVFPLALTGAVNLVAVVAQSYLYAHVEGTTIILPEDAPSKRVLCILLVFVAASNGFAIYFAWFSVFTVSRGGGTSSVRVLANVVAALVVAVVVTAWTLLTIIPMLKEH